LQVCTSEAEEKDLSTNLCWLQTLHSGSDRWRCCSELLDV